jgi:predicted O-methyltransferase YrrM
MPFRRAVKGARVASWQQISDFIHTIPSTTCGGLQPQFLYELSKGAGERGAVVEIGTYIGRSTIALAFAQKEKGGRPIQTIDIARHPQLDQNLREAGVDEFVDVTVRPSTDAARDWSEPIELLWIDADHSRVGLRADIKAWRDHVIEGGQVAFHDYPGVDSSKTVARPIAKLMLNDPVNWRVVSDREYGSIIVFERLSPGAALTARPTLRQRRKWAYREARAWLRLTGTRLRSRR